MFNEQPPSNQNQSGGGSMPPRQPHSQPPQRPPQYPPPMMPPRIPPRRNNTAAWVFVALITGFFLPICACMILIMMPFIGLSTLSESFDSSSDVETGPAVGVIDLVGTIATGDGYGATTGRFQTQLDWMAENTDVKALVIRANSPGGGVSASDEMWYMLDQFRLETGMPVVIYMHGTCASGCLYVASAGDELIANRASVVGSIGVISYFFDTSELLTDLGVQVDVVATADSKDFGSFFRPLTESEREFWLQQTNLLLDIFIDVVANRPGSTLSPTDVRELATGQVWVASEARDLGLIDLLGYEDDAFERAAALAGMGPNYRIQEYPFDFDLFSIFSGSGFSVENPLALPSTDDLLNELQQPPIQYRWMGPYDAPLAE